MKKILSLVLAMLLLLCTCAMADSVEAPAGDIIVLFTSDVHCGIQSGFGYEGLDLVRDGLVAAGNTVILVDNGDSIQGEPVGTMTKGEANIKLMNAMGYEVATMGNHEFDYGMDRFFELTEMAEFPYVSCNFRKNGEAVFAPYIIKELAGKKVAFIGVTTPRTLVSSTPTYFMDENGNFIYDFCQGDGTELYAAVQSAADAAREEGADYVVVMAHLGDEAECQPYTYADLIANTNNIDAVLDGHSHDTVSVEMNNKDGATVLRQGCGTKLEGIGYLKIAADGTLSCGLYTWGDGEHSCPETFNLDTDITAAVKDATAELNEALSTVVATTEYDLIIKDPETDERIVRNNETNLGDLCADAYLAASGADIAFVNGGGVRAKIAAGEITMNDILSVHPFGNMLTVVEANGQEILDALELSVANVPGEFGGFLHTAGLTYEVHTYIPSGVVLDENGMFVKVEGDRRIQNVLVNGEPIDPEKTYTLASHDYKLLNMGDGYSMFADNVVLQDRVMLDNQVLINYITNVLGGTIPEKYAEPYGEGRITFVTEAPAN